MLVLPNFVKSSHLSMIFRPTLGYTLERQKVELTYHCLLDVFTFLVEKVEL